MTDDTYSDVLVHVWKQDQNPEDAVLPADARPVYMDFDERDIAGTATNFQKTEEGITADITLEQEVPEEQTAVVGGWVGTFDEGEAKLECLGVVTATPEPEEMKALQGNLA